MKFSIPYTFDGKIMDSLKANHFNYVTEIYMPIPYEILPSGRGIIEKQREEYSDKFLQEVEKATKLGLRVNLLVNSPILTEGEITVKRVRHKLKQIKERYGVNKITISNFSMLENLDEWFIENEIDVELSVIDKIDTYNKAKFIKDSYASIKSICLNRRLLYDIEEIYKIKNKLQIDTKIILNDLCLIDCVWDYQHYTEICTNVCITQNHHCAKVTKLETFNILKETAFVRPEDIYLYDNVIDLFKISGRQETSNKIIGTLDSYIHGRYQGDIIDMLENSSMINYGLNNSLFPENYGIIKSNCKNKCKLGECNYCDELLRKLKINRK